MIGRLNERGNWVTYDNYFMRERYHYDLKLGCCFRQYDTYQDAPYFGVWVNHNDMCIVTFAEGDETIVYCLNRRSFNKELEDMHEFYEKEAFVA